MGSPAYWSSIMNLASELSKAIGKDKVDESPAVRQMYAYDSSHFINVPDIVVFTQNTSDVSKILKIAFTRGIPVVPRGAGTCLSGGAVPVKSGISLVMTRMNSVLKIDPVSRTALVEPGVVNLDLQKALAPHNLFFPPDPASQKVATIGGNVAECAGGIQGVRYGVTKNYVLGLELVLNDGAVVSTGMLSREEILGADSSGILNASEGTFAVITRILLSCVPKAESVRTALAAFPSLGDAANAVSSIIKLGIVPTALELLDKTLLKAVDDFIGVGFPPGAEAVLLLEVDGYEIDLDRQLALMVETCKTHGASDVRQAQSEAEREKLWKARRSGNGALGRIKPAYVVHDVTVRRDQVATLLTQIRAIGEKHNIIIAQMAHAGDGNAHPHLLYDPNEKNIQEKLHQVTEEIFKVALDLGGTLSGEHGIGLEKKAYMDLQFSKSTLGFMSKIKKLMDPSGILNPEKVLPETHENPRTHKGPAGSEVSVTSTRDIENDEPVPADRNADPRIISFLPDNLTIQVNGNTPLKKVLETAATINAFIPLCPHTQGNMSMAELVETAASGYSAMAHGSLREYIYGVTFSDISGELIKAGGHTAKNVAGFDLTRLFWGAGKSYGKIKNLTFKLLPRPEKEMFMVQPCSTLHGCIKIMDAVFKKDICLCTLRIIGTASQWKAVIGLSGSELCVNQHAEVIKQILEPAKEAYQIFENEDIGDFFCQEIKDSKNYATDLLYGRGLRSPMRMFIDKHLNRFSAMDDLRVEMDLGNPEIHIKTSRDFHDGNSHLWHCEDEPGFYLKRSDLSSGQNSDHGQVGVFNRLKGLRWAN